MNTHREPHERTMRQLIDHHFTGTGSARDEHTMRLHLDTCEACRSYYERRHVLARMAPGALSPETRIARGLGLSPRKRSPFVLPAMGLAMAFSIAVIVTRSSTSEMTARGGPATFSGLRPYAIRPGIKPRPILGTMQRTDALAFSYDNVEDKKYLMVFAVDEQRNVYWYHPTWTDAAQAPTAVAIGAGNIELAGAVHHRFAGRHIWLYSIAINAPARVVDIERLITAYEPGAALPLGDALVDARQEIIPVTLAD